MKSREETLKKYEEDLKNSATTEQIEKIKKAQDFIKKSQVDQTVLKDTEDRTAALDKSIDNTLSKYYKINKDLQSIIDKYKEKIDKAVEDSLKKTNKDEKERQTVAAVVDELKKSILAKVTDAVNDLPYYSNESIDKLKIADEDKEYLKKVNSFAEQYAKANREKITLKRRATTRSQDQLDNLKDAAVKNVKNVQTMSISTEQGKIKKVELLVNPQYKFASVSAKGANVTINSNKAVLNLTNKPSEVTVSYQLEYAKDVTLFTPAVVNATATTTETIKEAKTKEEVVEEKDKNGKKVKKKKNCYISRK